MWYVIVGRDRPDALAARSIARPAHLARLEKLKAEGRLLLAGPMPAIDTASPGAAGFAGSLIVADFASLDEARAFADADPYVSQGVYATVEVHPFHKALP